MILKRRAIWIACLAAGVGAALLLAVPIVLNPALLLTAYPTVFIPAIALCGASGVLRGSNRVDKDFLLYPKCDYNQVIEIQAVGESLTRTPLSRTPLEFSKEQLALLKTKPFPYVEVPSEHGPEHTFYVRTNAMMFRTLVSQLTDRETSAIIANDRLEGRRIAVAEPHGPALAADIVFYTGCELESFESLNKNVFRHRANTYVLIFSVTNAQLHGAIGASIYTADRIDFEIN